MTGRKLEGSDPLSEKRLELLDSAARWKSHNRLLDVFFNRLPQRKRILGHSIYHSAARHVLLAEESAGGYTELLRLERLGKENPTIRLVAEFARAAYEFVLDELDREGFELDVKPVPRPRWQEITSVAERQERVIRTFLAERKRGKKDSEAMRIAAEEHGYGRSQVERLTKHLRH